MQPGTAPCPALCVPNCLSPSAPLATLYELGERLKGRHHLTGSGPVAVRLVEGVEGHVGFSLAAGGGGGQ